MTREETIKLLKFLKGCYPNVKIDDAAGMADTWEMCFAEYTAQEIYKAARLHIRTNKYFPVPADIFECLGRAQLLFDTGPPGIDDGDQKKLIPAETEISDSIDAEYIIKFLGLDN